MHIQALYLLGCLQKLITIELSRSGAVEIWQLCLKYCLYLPSVLSFSFSLAFAINLILDHHMLWAFRERAEVIAKHEIRYPHISEHIARKFISLYFALDLISQAEALSLSYFIFPCYKKNFSS